MARRRLTLKRIDPWSVLKFGFVANLALLAIWLLGAGIIWFFVRQLGLIEKVCEIAGDVGFVECGVNGGNLFRALLLLGLLGTVIQTGLVVFLAFLHNLIADLVGGISFTYTEEGGIASTASTRSSSATTTQQAPPAESRRGAGAAAAGTAGASSTGSGGPPPPLGSERASRTGAEGPAPDRTTPARPLSDGPRETTEARPSGAPDTPAERSGGPVRPGSTAPSQPAAPSPSPGGGSSTDRPGSSPDRGAPSSDRPGSSPDRGGSSPDRGGSSPDWDLFGPRGSGGSGG